MDNVKPGSAASTHQQGRDGRHASGVDPRAEPYLVRLNDADARAKTALAETRQNLDHTRATLGRSAREADVSPQRDQSASRDHFNDPQFQREYAAYQAEKQQRELRDMERHQEIPKGMER